MIAIGSVGQMLEPAAHAHQNHKHHHHQHKKANAYNKGYNKGYKQGLRTGYYQRPYRYGYGYRPYSRPVVVAPKPWRAAPVQVRHPSVGFGFYF